MSPRLISILAAATVVAVAAAGYAVSQEQTFETVAENTRVFPDLRDKLNDVSELKMVTSAREMTFVREDGRWIMQESDGYEADIKSIQKVLIGLGDLQYAEAKTRKPELYAKLDLRETSIKGSRARHVTVKDGDGDVLVDVVLGKTRYNMPGTTRDGIYIRFPDDDQTWLSVGQLEASKLPGDWLLTPIVDVAGKTIKKAVFTHSDGEVLTVSKASEADEAFVLEGLPEDKKLKFASDPNNMAGVLEGLELADVRKASHFNFDADKVVTAAYETFDGLDVRVDMVQFQVPGEEEGDEEQTESWIRLVATGASPEAEKRATGIMDHTQGWAYKIPAYKASRLNKRMEEIIEDKKAGS